MNRFENRVVLVTGSASGIGQASALRIGQESGSVICADINLAGAEETAREIRDQGGGSIRPGL